MRIESEETINILIKTTTLTLASLFDQLTLGQGITRASGLVLFSIDEKKGTAATKIAPIMGMQNTSLSRLLKNMEKDGLIIRVPSKKDKRVVNVTLSEKGKERKIMVHKLVNDYNNYVNQRIDKEEMTIFKKTIKEIRKLTDAYKKLKNVSE